MPSIWNYKTFIQTGGRLWLLWLLRVLKFRAQAECQVCNTVWSKYDVQSYFLGCPVAFRHLGRVQVLGSPYILQRPHTSEIRVSQKKQFLQSAHPFFPATALPRFSFTVWLFFRFWLCTKKALRGTALFLFSPRCTDGWCLLNSFNHISQWLHTCWRKCGKF